jgi:uncharacterized protein
VIRVAAVGDVHAGLDSKGTLRPAFLELPDVADALLLAGDLTRLGTERELEVLLDELDGVTIPRLAVLGNHDYESGAADRVREILRGADVRLLDAQSCEVGEVAFVGIKGFMGGFGRRMLASFGEDAVRSFVAESVNEAIRLENAMRAVPNERAMIVLHYAPIPETIAGEPPEIFPFLGSSRLAETIDRFKVSAVVHGHAHRGKYEGRTPAGAPVYNVAFPIEKPTGRPYALIEI